MIRVVITGDIIGSRKISDQSIWINPLQDLFNKWGEQDSDWFIERGDFFQIHNNDLFNAFERILKIKALIKSIGLDVRLLLTIHNEEPLHSFYIEQMNTMKKKKEKLTLITDNDYANKHVKLYFKFADHFMNKWSTSSAELVNIILDYPDMTQDEISKKLSISQAGVNHRKKRSNIGLILEMNEIYKESMEETIPYSK